MQLSKTNQKGIMTMMLVMVGFLVLFSAFALLRIGSLDKIQPDLSRIGINSNTSQKTDTVAENNPPQAAPAASPEQTEPTLTAETGFQAASSDIDDSDSDVAEGDNPKYIE